MKILNEIIIEALRKNKRISEDNLKKVLEQCAKDPQLKFGDLLTQNGLIGERELASLLSAELQIPFLNLSRLKINVEIAQIIPEKFARKHLIVPVSKIGPKLTVAMADPLNIFALDDISILTKSKVDCVIATEKDIQETLEKLYASDSESISAIAQEMGALGEDIEMIKQTDEEGELAASSKENQVPMIKMVDLLLREAMKKRASDIHIEPFENRIRVRYRVDGHMQEEFTIPKKNQSALLTRLKIMSKLDITENRIPQDGRFKIRFPEKEVDFRVSVLPTYFGSKVVMRLLDKTALSVGLENLGLLPETLGAFNSAVAKPFGMILITGPTGSGKSTTLYSILNKLNTVDRNIITIEDPIEYQVKGISQIAVRHEVGMDFASGLRAILRQSPDVVMVGEIRDGETADIAIKASLTGQIVLSTLHTNDAPGAVTRLADMGVEPFLISSSLVLVAAQRLCRRICPACKEKAEYPPEVFKKMGVDIEALAPDPKNIMFMKPRGCDKCGKTGYKGRMSIIEALTIDDNIRDMITNRASSMDIKKYAVSSGMSTLRVDALKKFCMGFTTLDEVIHVTSEDH